MAAELGFTSLGQRTKKRGTTTIMQQNVSQNTASERRNTSRSPEERAQRTTMSEVLREPSRAPAEARVFAHREE